MINKMIGRRELLSNKTRYSLAFFVLFLPNKDKDRYNFVYTPD